MLASTTYATKRPHARAAAAWRHCAWRRPQLIDRLFGWRTGTMKGRGARLCHRIKPNTSAQCVRRFNSAAAALQPAPCRAPLEHCCLGRTGGAPLASLPIGAAAAVAALAPVSSVDGEQLAAVGSRVAGAAGIAAGCWLVFGMNDMNMAHEPPEPTDLPAPKPPCTAGGCRMTARRGRLLTVLLCTYHPFLAPPAGLNVQWPSLGRSSGAAVARRGTRCRPRQGVDCRSAAHTELSSRGAERAQTCRCTRRSNTAMG